MAKKGLGRGLDALITEQPQTQTESNGITKVDINNVEPNRNQPRKFFSEDSLQELADSIKRFGVIQPLIVKKSDGYYEIVAGERRWRASRKAGLYEVPVIIMEASELEALEISLIENLQRENLNPIEEANTYKRLIDEFGLKQEELAERISKSRPAITNCMRLLQLDSRVINLLIAEKISAGHGKALLALQDNDMQFEIAEKIIEDGLSVRAVETLVQALLEKKPDDAKVTKSAKSTEYVSIEKELNRIFGTKVKISNGKNKGKIEIEFFSEDDLDRLFLIMKQFGE